MFVTKSSEQLCNIDFMMETAFVHRIIPFQLMNMPKGKKRNYLPPRLNCEIPNDYVDRLKTLENLGFCRSDCEKALKYSSYVVERAGEMLIDGNLPSDFCESESEFIRKRENLKRTYLINERRQLPQNEVKDLKELLNIGIEKDLTYQVYMIMDKDLELSRSALMSF